MIQLVSQDKDKIILFEPETMTLNLEPVIINDKIMAINLMCNDWLLGTFDSTIDAVNEIYAILAIKDGVFEISGYSNYDGEKDFRELIERWTEQDEAILTAWANC